MRDIIVAAAEQAAVRKRSITDWPAEESEELERRVHLRVESAVGEAQREWRDEMDAMDAERTAEIASLRDALARLRAEGGHLAIANEEPSPVDAALSERNTGSSETSPPRRRRSRRRRRSSPPNATAPRRWRGASTTHAPSKQSANSANPNQTPAHSLSPFATNWRRRRDWPPYRNVRLSAPRTPPRSKPREAGGPPSRRPRLPPPRHKCPRRCSRGGDRRCSGYCSSRDARRLKPGTLSERTPRRRSHYGINSSRRGAPRTPRPRRKTRRRLARGDSTTRSPPRTRMKKNGASSSPRNVETRVFWRNPSRPFP